MDVVLLFMQLLAAQYCPLPTHRRVEAIANRQPPRPSLGGVRQIDHVAMCGSERSLRSYTIFAVSPGAGFTTPLRLTKAGRPD